jgi:GT2 family glycosyltransferase
VTGPAAPLELETPAQEWFERTNAFSRGFDRTVHDGATGDPFFVARVGAGVNMALRRIVLAVVGPFDEALDSGTPTLGGGDHDMFTRILAQGYRIVYQPDALVRHRHRRAWDELRNTFRAYGTGAYAYLTRHALRGEWRAPLVAMAWLPSQLGRLARALVSGAHRPYLSLGWSELLGCAAGPFAYVRSRRGAPAPVPEPSPLPDEPARQLRGRLEPVQDPPRLSVIIPTHDRRAHIERILTCLRTDAYPAGSFEVIVVADGCADGTADLVRHTTTPFALRVEELSPGRGAAAARNRGAALATGAILLFLDDDMDPPTWFLSEHAALHEEGADRVVVGAPIPARPGPGATQYDIAMWSWWEMQFEQLSLRGHRFRHDEIFTGVLSVPAALFSRLGGFDESFECREDYELGARLIRSGVEIGFSRQAGAHHLELRSPERLYERKRAEGRADVALARKHLFLWPALRLAQRMPSWWTAMGILRRLSNVPVLANAVAAFLARTLPALERLHARATWRAVHSALVYLWYWRGVRDLIDDAGLRTLGAECASASVPVRAIDVDLGAGLRTAERRLDQERPDAVRVRFGDAELGTIGAVSGGERLRGIHLRPALARDVGESLARALDTAQARERPRLTTTHR